MKTYKIELSNEPLKEGCLTQYGCIESIRALCYYVGFKFKPLDKNDLKHLKCYEVSEPLNLNGEDDYNWGRNIEVTNPLELQKIWEAIRGDEPTDDNHHAIFTNQEFTYLVKKWQNFTLKPGTYELFGNTEQPLPEEDNNGWISVLDKNPPDGEIVLYYVPEIVRTGYLLKGTWYKNLNNGEYDTVVMPDVTHWQPLPKPPKH